MLNRRGIDARVGLFALLAIAFGGWAWTVLPLSDGTWERIGPGVVPRAAAMALVVTGAVLLIRAVTGIANAPPRPMWLPWRLILALALAVCLFVEDIVAFFPDEPTLDQLRTGLAELRLKAGPAELLAWTWLRWVLAVAIGVIAAGEGALSGIVALLAGILLGLAGTDVTSGVDRLPQIEQLLDKAAASIMIESGPLMVLIGLAAVTILCRVNPLPAMFAYLSAGAAEEAFRRAMLISKGDALLAIERRPIALTLLAASVLVLLALAVYRWPWRGGRRKSGRS